MAVFQSLGTPQPQQSQPQNVEPSRAKKVLRYTMMPEILPRIRGLGIHFGHFAYLLALVFASARLIPQAHPVMNAANIGRFGVRQVIAIAANNLTWTMKNIDQIAIFSAIVMGLIMIVVQLGLIAFMAIMGTANAQVVTGDPSGFFTVDNPEQDVVLQILNLIFGRPEGGEFFFAPMDPDYSGLSGNYDPIYKTIYQILSMYSLATMVIAVIIVLYYIMTVIGEAAKTGTPFGQRFNSLWAPIRLIVALGLLVPLGSGMNSAQYITLWMAKQGSNLGTNVWYLFFDNVVTVDPSRYVVTDSKPYSMESIVYDAFLSEVCIQGYNQMNNGAGVSWSRQGPVDIGSGFKIVWGATPADQAPNNRRNCGELTVAPSTSNSLRGRNNPNSAGAADDIIPIDQITAMVQPIVENTIIGGVESLAAQYVAYAVAEPSSGSNPLASIKGQLDTIAETASQDYKTGIEAIYTSAVQANLASKLEQDRDKGWAYAGVWYLQIGRLMQQLENPKTTAIPSIKLPDQAAVDPDRPGVWDRIQNTLGWGTYGKVDGALEAARGYINQPDRMTAAQRRAARHGTRTNSAGQEDTAYNACIGLDSAATILEKVKCTVFTMIIPDELFVIKNGSTLDPMAALVAAGGAIFEKAVYFGIAGLMAEAGGGLIGSLPPPVGVALRIFGGILDAVGGILIVIALLGLAAGFVLFFLLPLMPFVYFFFAIMSWLMEIFEAIVAMPLWALAHLKIDGDGMPGPAAINGYYLLLGILIRPALIVIGLIGGYLIFISGTYMLSLIFDPVLNVVTGDDTAGIQMLIFTLIFSFLVYNIGLVAFKMVDTVPQQILRWIGSGAQQFSDGKSDIVGSTQGAIIGAAAIGSQISGQLSGGAKGMGQGVGKYKQEQKSMRDQAAGDRESEKRHTEMVEAIKGSGGSGSGGGGVGPAGRDGKDGLKGNAGERGLGGERGERGRDGMSGQGSGSLGDQWRVDPNKKTDDKK